MRHFKGTELVPVFSQLTAPWNQCCNLYQRRTSSPASDDVCPQAAPRDPLQPATIMATAGCTGEHTGRRTAEQISHLCNPFLNHARPSHFWGSSTFSDRQFLMRKLIMSLHTLSSLSSLGTRKYVHHHTLRYKLSRPSLCCLFVQHKRMRGLFLSKASFAMLH